MTRKRLLILFTILASLFSWAMPSPSYACSPGPEPDYKITSQNGKFIYLAFAKGRELPGPIFPDLYNKYQQSGLFRNDGSTEMLWTIGKTSRDAVLANDGQHIMTADRDNLLAFYENGRRLKGYTMENLGITIEYGMGSCTANWKKGGRESGQTRDSWAKQSYDESTNRYVVNTFAGETYIFDLEGNVVEYRGDWSWLIIGLIVALIIVLFFIRYYTGRRARR